jgi:type I restriction enzyme, S subunit
MKWPTLAFETLAEVVTGNTPARSEPENYGSGVPWVKPPDLDAFEAIKHADEELSEIGQEKARLLPPGAVLVCCIGATIGKVGIAGRTLATNQQINSLVFSPVIEPQFGYYYCKSIAGLFRSLATQTGLPILNKGNFQKIKMPVPSLSEQRRIVKILHQADTLRRKRHEADTKAARILPALFNKMFGDPATNPKGWPTANLCDVADIGTQMVDPTRPEFLDLPHIGGEQIEKDTGRVVSPKLVRDSDLRSGKFLFAGDHLLYSKIRPYLNKVAYPGFRGVCSADIYPIRPRGDRVSHWYLVALLRSSAFLAYARAHSERLRIPKLNRDQLGTFVTPLPSTSRLNAFEEQARRIEVLEKARFRQEDRISTLFNKLLRLAFTGDLTAKWREAHMQELLQEVECQATVLRRLGA